MTRPSRRRRFAPLALGLALCLASAPAPVQAQEPPPEGGEAAAAGRPFDGYFATGILGFLALACVAKSARR